MMHGTNSTSFSADQLTGFLSRPRLAVLDSGVGGLPYLHWIFRARPAGAYIYLADTAGFPYGSKGENEIIEIVTRMIGCLNESFDPDIFLVACNTASVVALGALRERFSKPFVGVVPAVKPAAQQSRLRRIGLIATSETVVSSYTENLISTFAADCRVLRFAGQDLVDFVENDLTRADEKARLEAVRPACDFFREERVDTVVLGCTHYLHLQKEFRTLLGPDIRVVDSVEGVGRQVLRRLEDFPDPGQRGSVFDIYTSSPFPGPAYDDFAALYGASYRGVLGCP
ncbi:glutamate racemase [Marispirochaeta aestuarii]|uniref:glutamate racemase n=1 Tax=Marispirochaeta aestuarii TaxID=1963862 RepID=UPI0029C887EF|nr:glutamate racemase [Marispirochaeta aestuarii]